MGRITRIEWLWRLGWVAIAFAAAIDVGTGLTSDTNTLFQLSTHLVTVGGVYSHWMEINPPLVLFVYALPALIVAKLHWSAAAVLHIFTLLLCLGSLTLIAKVATAGLPAAERRVWLFAAAFAFFFGPPLFHVFADREYLLFVFAMPWMIERLLGRRPGKLVCAAAAIGFCLKPYNLAIFAALLFFAGPRDETLREKILSRSVIIVGAFGAVYLGLVYLYMPAYILQTVPFGLTTYSALLDPLAFRAFDSVAYLVGVIILVEVAGAPKGRLPSYVFIVSALLVFLLNGGWQYTKFVPFAAAILIGALQLGEGVALPSASGRRMRAALALFACFLLVFLALDLRRMKIDVRSTMNNGYGFEYQTIAAANGLQPKLIEAATPHFILLSTTVWSSTISGPHLTPSTDFGWDYLWTLPWVVKNPGDLRATKIRAAMEESFAQALRDAPDATVIVDISPKPRRLPDDFRILDYLREDPSVADAFSRYRKAETLDACTPDVQGRCRFEIWRPE